LSVAEGHDGRALLKCFVGCEAADIAAAVGLRLSDLFHAPITCATPEERKETRQRVREANWSAALSVLALEARVVLVAARQLKYWQTLDEDDDRRLLEALKRIESAANILTNVPLWRPKVAA
jgi:hypothetical protein